MDFYIFLSSQDGKQLYPGNSGRYFIVQLLQQLDFAGEWEVALSNIYIQPKDGTNTRLLVCCDFVDYAIVGDLLQPVLQRASSTNPGFVIEHFYWVTQTHICQIHIFVLD